MRDDSIPPRQVQTDSRGPSSDLSFPAGTLRVPALQTGPPQGSLGEDDTLGRAQDPPAFSRGPGRAGRGGPAGAQTGSPPNRCGPAEPRGAGTAAAARTCRGCANARTLGRAAGALSLAAAAVSGQTCWSAAAARAARSLAEPRRPGLARPPAMVSWIISRLVV